MFHAGANVHTQTRSAFFSNLPPEIRIKIEIEYLVFYLQDFAVEQCKQKEVYANIEKPDGLLRDDVKMLFSTPLSPLSMSCKRMCLEMKHRASFGLLFVARDSLPPGHPTDRRMGLAVEGSFCWESLRNLRLVKEKTTGTATRTIESGWIWQKFILDCLIHAVNLTEIVFEWGPRAVIENKDGFGIMQAIEKHPCIRTIRLRGTTIPRSWLKLKPRGINVIREPLWWTVRDLEEEAKYMARRRRVRAQARRGRQLFIQRAQEERERRRQRELRSEQEM